MPVTYLVIHHSAGSRCFTPLESGKALRGIQNFHMDTRGWWDIGYSFLISEDGNLYEGRGWDTEGAHTLHYNKDSYGVCFLGSFTDETPRSAALQKVEILIRTGISRGHLRPDYILKGHRDLGDTECPGEALYEHIQTLPHFQP
ncbi:peptidoglycan recognition protein 1-like isoform X3 [Ambystoma mexicanum]